MDVEQKHELVNSLIEEVIHSSEPDSSVQNQRRLSLAFELERDVADAFMDRLNAQPFRAHLYARAAQLGNRVGRPREVPELVNEGLRGDVPADLAAALNRELSKALKNGAKLLAVSVVREHRADYGLLGH